jgi:cytochrome c-type biogenesis protein CcmF
MTVSRMPMTEVAIDRGVTRDLYVALGERRSATTAWSVRVHHKPFVNWIWGGCVLMALGGVLAVLDRRYRVRRSAAAPAAVNSAAPPMKPANPVLAGKGALR